MKRRTLLKCIIGGIFAPKLLKANGDTVQGARQSVQFEWKDLQPPYKGNCITFEEARRFLLELEQLATGVTKQSFRASELIVNERGYDIIKYAHYVATREERCSYYSLLSMPENRVFRRVFRHIIYLDFKDCHREPVYMFYNIPVIVSFTEQNIAWSDKNKPHALFRLIF